MAGSRSRPRLLDLFCGAGGAAMGYHRAGFDVCGVDIDPQEHYPFAFAQADALRVLRELVDGSGSWDIRDFDAIHASPPCQAYMRSGNVDRDKHPELLAPTRELLEATGLPWVIENVPGAPMRPDAVLCGSHFGLPIRRHRWFELSWHETVMTLGCDHSRPVTGVYGHPHGAGGAAAGMLPSDLATWSVGLGIDWMTAAELALAIPPAYTELIGGLVLEHLELERRTAEQAANVAGVSRLDRAGESTRVASGLAVPSDSPRRAAVAAHRHRELESSSEARRRPVPLHVRHEPLAGIRPVDPSRGEPLEHVIGESGQ